MRMAGNKKKLSAVISFTSGQGPDGPYRHLRIVDEKSRLTIASIDMTHEAFGRALAFGEGKPNCSVELFENPNFGKTLEVKTEKVEVVYLTYEQEHKKGRLIDAIKCAGLEHDGWVADIDVNSRRYNRVDRTQQVTFRRYV